LFLLCLFFKYIYTFIFSRGYNIGIRLVDEFCAKSRIVRCKTFRDTIETIAKDGFKMFLGINGVVENWGNDNQSCTIRLPDNPLAGKFDYSCVYLYIYIVAINMYIVNCYRIEDNNRR